MKEITNNSRLPLVGFLFVALSVIASGARSDDFQIEHSFDPILEGGLPYTGLTLGADGNLYGLLDWRAGCKKVACFWTYQLASGAVTEFNIYESKHHLTPTTDLVVGTNNSFYGASTTGGSGFGEIYKIPPTGHAQPVVYKFKNEEDGNSPNALIAGKHGHFYGAAAGGSFGKGLVFDISASGHLKVRYAFAGGADGNSPGHLVADDHGNIYGATRNDGTNFGTIFKISGKGKKEILYTFLGGNDGSDADSLLLAPSGDLYGTTYFGGGGTCSNGCGTVFKLTQKGQKSTVYAFTDEVNDGLGPNSLLLASTGLLYGTTFQGGSHSSAACSGTCGTIYSLNPDGTKTILHEFTGGEDGQWPAASLFQLGGTLLEVNGRVYGNALEGGNAPCGPNQDLGCGTIYSVAE